MRELSNYQQELKQVLFYALNEFDATYIKWRRPEDFQDSNIVFGLLSVDVSWIVVDNNRIFLQYYNVKDNCGLVVCRFYIGYAPMLYAQSAKKFRETILNEDNIQGVVTLKQSHNAQTVIPIAIIFVGKCDSDIWLASVDKKEQVVSLYFGETNSEMKVFHTDTLSAENFMPDRYNGDEEYIEDKLKGYVVKELGEITQIIPGKGASRYDYTDSGIPYLRVQDIKGGRIEKPKVYLSLDKISEYSRQLLQEGDILLSKNYGQNKIALVTKNDIPAVVSNNLYIVRPYDISEKYLYRYLTSKTGNEVFNKQLNRIQRGLVIRSVALSDLIHVEVPVFDDTTMQMLDNMDSVTKDDAIITTQQMFSNLRLATETDIEQSLINSLVQADWNIESFKEEQITVSDGETSWRPDIVYHLDDGRKVIFEIIKSLTESDAAKTIAILKMLQGDEDCFVILTTGLYFEIHKPGVKESLKTISIPTVDSILIWEKEVL